MSLKGIAKETLAILDQGGYKSPSGIWVELGKERDEAIKGTRLYTPSMFDKLLSEPSKNGNPPTYEVFNETTQSAAYRLVNDESIEDLVLLNFASARNAGGGFINGAKAQEEDITRCSGLYPCLLTQPTYYKANREQDSLLYTDHIIYSPKVPWFRKQNRDLLEKIFLASVITAPAPNAGQILKKNSEDRSKIEECLQRRSGMVLAVARDNGHRNLLLGAWGCGVFKNEPAMVANAFGLWLNSDEFKGNFDKVIFAVLDSSKNAETFNVFKERFGKNM